MCIRDSLQYQRRKPCRDLCRKWNDDPLRRPDLLCPVSYTHLDVYKRQGKIIYEPYKIRVFNTINFQKSMHFNPFAYIHSEKDILKIVTTLIANTKGEGKAGDDFWVKAETLLYTALIGYIYYEAPANEQNFATLVEMLNAMEVREDDESFKNAVDLLDVYKRQPPRRSSRRNSRPSGTSWIRRKHRARRSTRRKSRSRPRIGVWSCEQTRCEEAHSSEPSVCLRLLLCG